MKTKYLLLIPVVAGTIFSTSCQQANYGGTSFVTTLLQIFTNAAKKSTTTNTSTTTNNVTNNTTNNTTTNNTTNNTTNLFTKTGSSSNTDTGTGAVSSANANALLERIFVTHVNAMNQNTEGQAAINELNKYMDKCIPDIKTLNDIVEKMSAKEKQAFAVVVKSYLQKHLQDDALYAEVQVACMLANPAKYGIYRGYFQKMLSMLPQP